jgi:hypothetical protein
MIITQILTTTHIIATTPHIKFLIFEKGESLKFSGSEISITLEKGSRAFALGKKEKSFTSVVKIQLIFDIKDHIFLTAAI